MADEDAEDVAEEATDEESGGEGEDSGAEKPKKPKKEEPKKSKKLYVFLGIGLVFGIGSIAGIYYYNEWEKRQHAAKSAPVLSKEEKVAIAKEKKVESVVKKLKIKRKYFDECNQMSEQYVTPKGWDYSTSPLRTLLGLSKYAVEKDVEARCVQFARVVEDMEKISKQIRHVFMCNDAKFELKGGFFFKPSPNKDGIIQGHEALPGKGKFMKIGVGKSRMHSQWQFHNVGDGCIVVGYSKLKGQTFIMGGEVVADPKK